jgi:phytoene dehydrogenase-like protein
VLASVLVVATACGGSSPSVRSSFDDGVRAIRQTHDHVRLRAELRRTVTRLRATHDGRGRLLALRGFEATERGLQAAIDFVANDRGNIRAATRDARREDRWLGRGAELLRRAGRELGVRVGRLNGY